MKPEAALNAEEKVPSLFQPDTLLPAEYIATFKRKLHLEPERKLMLAVLEDAITCYRRFAGVGAGKGRKLYREVEDWFMEEQSEWLFSFNNICEVLGFDPQYVRQGILCWKKGQLETRSETGICHLVPRIALRKRRIKIYRTNSRPGRPEAKVGWRKNRKGAA